MVNTCGTDTATQTILPARERSKGAIHSSHRRWDHAGSLADNCRTEATLRLLCVHNFDLYLQMLLDCEHEKSIVNDVM